MAGELRLHESGLSGLVRELVTDLALCDATAAREAPGTARVFAKYEVAGREQASPAPAAPPTGSCRSCCLPVFTVEQLVDEFGDVPELSVHRGEQAPEEAHVVESVTERVRGRAYAAMDVLRGA